MECRDNIPSWSGPSPLVDDNIQAQGRFSCECLPDHHWDSAGVGREDEKEQYKAVNTRFDVRDDTDVAEPNLLASEMGAAEASPHILCETESLQAGSS